MVRIKLALAAFVFSTAAQPPQPAPITGWWRASLSHDGESQDIWLHFQDRGGNLIASFSNPQIGIDDTPLSRVTETPETVELSSIGWSLHRNVDGTLSGTIPDALVPVYGLPAQFERSQAPQPAVSPQPATPAPKPQWQQSVGAKVYAGLTFDAFRKHVIVATDAGKVAALRARSGQLAWSAEGGAPIRATPLVAGKAIYVPTDMALLKLDASTGRRIWSAPIGVSKAQRLEIDDPKSRWDHYSSSAVVSGSAVYVGSRDGCVYRFSAASGTRLGHYCASDLVTATPVVDGDRIYFASFDKTVYAADVASGRTLWKRNVSGEVPRDLALAGRNILAGSRSYDLVALDKLTGRPSWNRYYWFSWVDSPPNLAGNVVYIGASDALHVFAFDGTSGGKLWESRVPGWTWAKPAVGRTTVYAAVTGTAGPYVGPRAGGFAAIDRKSGKLRWFVPSEKPEKAPVYGFASAPVVGDGMVYAADLAGNVFAFRTSN
jgi:outer membrane protein assembly factor BamB